MRGGKYHLWAVWFRCHIHTDVERKLAIFRTKREANDWVSQHGIRGEMNVVKLQLIDNLDERRS